MSSSSSQIFSRKNMVVAKTLGFPPLQRQGAVRDHVIPDRPPFPPFSAFERERTSAPRHGIFRPLGQVRTVRPNLPWIVPRTTLRRKDRTVNHHLPGTTSPSPCLAGAGLRRRRARLRRRGPTPPPPGVRPPHPPVPSATRAGTPAPTRASSAIGDSLGLHISHQQDPHPRRVRRGLHLLRRRRLRP